jgi:phosphatidylserine/phosphatidylglycerophosphate/cardiolipin synthase-like enzyme
MSVEVLFNRPDRPLPIDDLIHEIYAVQERIVLASAWFTDAGISQAIIDSRAKTKIIILNRSDLKRDESQAYKRIARDPYIGSGRHGSGVYVLGGTSWEQGVMHHKFCLLDYHVVWTGSFNYTMHALRNYEALLRIEDMAINELFWDESQALVNQAPYRDDVDERLIDGEFYERCRRPLTPNEVCAYNSDGQVWCDRCSEPDHTS